MCGHLRALEHKRQLIELPPEPWCHPPGLDVLDHVEHDPGSYAEVQRCRLGSLSSDRFAAHQRATPIVWAPEPALALSRQDARYRAVAVPDSSHSNGTRHSVA